MPDLTSNQFWVHVIVRNDVHVVPPSIEEVVVVLVVHSHIENVHGRQMARCRRADHLTVMHDTVVSCAHGIQMLITLIRNEHDLTHPLALAHKLTSKLLSW